MLEPTDSRSIINKCVSFEKANINITYVCDDEKINNDLHNFFCKMGFNKNEMQYVWAVDIAGTHRKRCLVHIDNILVAVSSWDVPQLVNTEIIFYLIVDEDNEFSEKIIDHLLESVSRSTVNDNTVKIVLKTAVFQSKTRASAVERGYVSTFGTHFGNDDLVKISHFGVLTDANWDDFRRKFFKYTGLTVNEFIPISDSVFEDVIVLENTSLNSKFVFSIYDFEKIISPALILSKNRKAILIPIKANYANALGITSPRQLSLLPEKEALLHVEKAYFRSVNRVKYYNEGMLVIFYLSGDFYDSKVIAGCGRITYSSTHHLSDIKAKFFRQGVLSENKLRSIANKKNEIHVFVFGNYLSVTNIVDYKYLKKKSYINGANLVTGEVLEFYKTVDIINKAFSRGIN